MLPANPDRDRRALLVETLAVVAVLWLPEFANSLWSRADPAPRSLASESVQLTIDAGVIALLLYLVWRNGESFRHLGLRRTRWWGELLWAFGIYCLSWMAEVAFHATAEAAGWKEPAPAVDPYPSGARAVLLPFFLLVSAAGEELLFRGYLFNRVRRLTGSAPAAILLPSILFAAYHPYGPRELVAIFLFGSIFALLYWKARSLPRFVLAHCAFNLSISYEWWRL